MLKDAVDRKAIKVDEAYVAFCAKFQEVSSVMQPLLS
jgi:hypothetical protein